MKGIVVGSGIFVGVGLVVSASALIVEEDLSLARNVALTLSLVLLALAGWFAYAVIGVSLLRTIRRWKDPEARSDSG